MTFGVIVASMGIAGWSGVVGLSTPITPEDRLRRARRTLDLRFDPEVSRLGVLALAWLVILPFCQEQTDRILEPDGRKFLSLIR
jgi:hypothetical protein